MNEPEWLTQTREHYAALYLDAVFAYPESAKPVPLWLCVTIQQTAVAATINRLMRAGTPVTIGNVVLNLGAEPWLALDYWPTDKTKEKSRTPNDLRGLITKLGRIHEAYKALDDIDEQARLLRANVVRERLVRALEAFDKGAWSGDEQERYLWSTK